MKKKSILFFAFLINFWGLQAQNHYSRDFTDYYSIDTIISLQGKLTISQVLLPVLYQNDSLILISQVSEDKNFLNCIEIIKSNNAIEEFKVKVPSLKLMIDNHYRLSSQAFDGYNLYLNFGNNLFQFQKQKTKIKLVNSRDNLFDFDNIYIFKKKVICIRNDTKGSTFYSLSNQSLKTLDSIKDFCEFPYFYNNFQPKNRFSLLGDELLVSGTVGSKFKIYNVNDMSIIDSVQFNLEKCPLLSDSIIKKLSVLNDMQFLQAIGTGEFKKYVRIIGFYRIGLDKIMVFYQLARNNIGNTYAAVLNKQNNKWITEKQDINLVQSDLKKVISNNYFPTDFFAQNLSVQGNNFAKLIMYPDSLQYGITNQVHISNFSKLNNLSMYLVIGKINLNP
jgi:hypothetical protein